MSSRTPVHDWRGREIEALLAPGTRVNLKLELFQQSGTFKARGALSKMLRLTPEERARGVTAVSAGNHAIATAYAAAGLGASAKVVMMGSANPARVAACRALGAEVVTAPDGRTAFEMVEAIARDEGRSFIHPVRRPLYGARHGDARHGMARAGARSRRGDHRDRRRRPVRRRLGRDQAAEAGCLVFGVEPTGSDTMTRSFAQGQPGRPCRGEDDRRQPRPAFRSALQLRPLPRECRRSRPGRRRRRSAPPWRCCSAR